MAAKCNFVAQDQIWKDHVRHETGAAKKWPNNWDFLTVPYKDLMKDEISQKEKKGKIEPPSGMQIAPVTPITELVTVLPSTEPVPVRTSGMIGWRSSVTELKLEKYGKYTKPRGGLIKQLKWPVEATV